MISPVSSQASDYVPAAQSAKQQAQPGSATPASGGFRSIKCGSESGHLGSGDVDHDGDSH